MSGHRVSRRRDYGRRQKDVRGRRTEAISIDLDGPTLWARGRAWDDASRRQSHMSQAHLGEPSSGADRSVGGQGN